MPETLLMNNKSSPNRMREGAHGEGNGGERLTRGDLQHVGSCASLTSPPLPGLHVCADPHGALLTVDAVEPV